MPFVQRVVQPVNLAQVVVSGSSGNGSGVSASGKAVKFHCMSGKCQNNNCISIANSTNNESARINAAASPTPSSSSRTLIGNVKDNNDAISNNTTTTIKAIIHAPLLNGDAAIASAANTPTSHSNGFSSFTYATDTEDEPPLSPAAPLSMKKLKQHVEFLSTSPSPARSLSRPSTRAPLEGHGTQGNAASQRRSAQSVATAAKIVPGFEFDSISNITLSNALRQLASLVLIASDIFDDLQRELQCVGDRARVVQRKIVAVERRVCAYDPKMVTVPESDLLTFAQRKVHYESEKSIQTDLFTAVTRPRSVRMLYEDAGKVSPTTSATTSPRHLAPFSHDGGINGGVLNGNAGAEDIISCGDTGAQNAAGSDELVCTPVFGKANRKMRTRIDAEIEIRLPAAIEDLRKWTSTEALGDVTVTPDCMHHVDTSINTSLVIGDNGILTPALSPSMLSADAVDAFNCTNKSIAMDPTHITNDFNKDVPLNHRLPSPEEQCKIIALRYPAEVVSVDTSGKRFQRMCMARKSTTGVFTNMAETNNLNDDVQTVSRRSRSRKVRGKRRNTIAGIDQKEIQDAANGESTTTNVSSGDATTSSKAYANEHNGQRSDDAKSKKFGRSKSSDILKKDAVALPYDKGKNTLTRLNSLKQWGRNRFKFMTRQEPAPLVFYGGLSQQINVPANVTVATAEQINSSSGSSQNSCSENKTADAQSSSSVGGVSSKTTATLHSADMDDGTSVLGVKSEGRFSHERKPSYSSSEKSMSVSSSGHLRGKLHLATSAGNVKLRDTSSLNRQRRNGINANGLKEEQPHSSSGNWSASSESGRASIGSEITIQPKSSASSTSLNVNSFHTGSGPPSSMLSRRRFLNTSASSSVTSEGTATPELQVHDGYGNHLDDETSSAYSCDTEGYYTSFHMDSGLRTLKEEELLMTPLQLQQLQQQQHSFGSQFNQTMLSAENEYELFGRGSTSTTTSSAGTVCTTLRVHSEQSSLNGLCPDVPERISSLSKLNNSGHGSNSASSSTLERSYSSSTMGSTLERTGTIKRNVNAALKLNQQPNQSVEQTNENAAETQCNRNMLPKNMLAEVECSESSDLEGVERIERIKQKTAINVKRIPSMCIITPTTSDDENQRGTTPTPSEAYDPNRTLTNDESLLYISEILSESNSESAAEEAMHSKPKDHNLNVLKRASNNMLEKLKVVMPNIKRKDNALMQEDAKTTDDLYDLAGEYVTIADISNNNRQKQLQAPKLAGGLGIYYSNDIVSRGSNTKTALARSNEPQSALEMEYVSLNELPFTARKSSVLASEEQAKITTPATNTQCAEAALPSATSGSTATVPMYAEINELRESMPSVGSLQTKGARVRLNAHGKPIYDSDSLKRRKGAHTTFAPGPFVKETESALNSQSDIYESIESNLNIKQTGESANLLPKSNTNNAAKLLVGSKRLVANVRPIVSQRAPTLPNHSNMSYLDENAGPPAYSQHYQEHKNLLANQTNPFFQNTTTPAMMPSPSSKSTSSNGSSNASSSSANSTLSREEGYPPFCKPGTELQQPMMQTQLRNSQTQVPIAAASVTPFQRNSPVYWTLQNRRQSRPQPSSVTSRDDLYATPIKRSERAAAAAAAAIAAAAPENISNTASANVSPIVPRYRNNFRTSTPTNLDSQLPGDDIPAKQPLARNINWQDDNAPERFNTCADRIGQSKTSLMDFKKLLLAKSTKSSPVQKKVSAVELLKKGNAVAGVGAGAITAAGNAPINTTVQALNSSMKLLDLSGSPKTFASRRMLRQGQFGSPSKNIVPKLKNATANWRANQVQHTDIMSTAIPEANSEEDHSSTSGSNSSKNSLEISADKQSTEPKYDLRSNFFMQTDENNFMRGEQKQNFLRNTPLTSSVGANKYVSGAVGTATPMSKSLHAENDADKCKAMAALETAL